MGGQKNFTHTNFKLIYHDYTADCVITKQVLTINVWFD